MIGATVTIPGFAPITVTAPVVPQQTLMLVGGTLRNNNPSDGSKTGYADAGRPKWDIVRVYNQGDALKALSSGWGRTVAVSYTPTLGTGWSNIPSKVAALRANLQALPDIPGIRVIAFHEPEDNYGRTAAGAALYCADEAVFEPMVRQVNQTRSNPLTACRDFMAYSIQSAAWSTTRFAQLRRAIRKAASKIRLATAPPDLSLYCAGMGNDVELGLDVYSINQIGLSVAFAQQQGKVLCVPEMGPLNAVPQNDAAMLAYAQQGYPAYVAAGATWCTWFDVNGAGADLDQYPKTLTYIGGLV